jgi:cobalamin-dependent methionine synthase I
VTTNPKRIHLKPLAPYEDRLLHALAFFRTKRQATTQAHHCLSMYLRSSESRIMSEVGFYSKMAGLDKTKFLELIYQDPDKAAQLIKDSTGINISDVFDPDLHDAESSQF